MSSQSVSSILESIATAGKAYEKNEAGSREALIDSSRALVAALEIPSEFRASGLKSFKPSNAGDAGVTPQVLSEKTGVDVLLLSRAMRHLVAMYVVTYHDGAFHGTTLSNGLAEERYQHSLSFCYDAARPSFNSFPEFFKKTGYKQPSSLTDGPFQAAHKTKLPILAPFPIH